MAWVESLFTRETLPVLEASLGFAHKRQLTIMNNIANVETPYYKRQDVPDGEFHRAMKDALRERRELHPNEFNMRDTRRIDFVGGWYPRVRRKEGQEWGPERHDENNVVIEKEMAELAKNTLRTQTMQRLMKKKLGMLRMSLRDRIG